MSERFFKSLLARPNIRSSNGVQILAGNSTCIPLIGFGIFFQSINGQSLCHDFGVVESLPLDVVIGREIMRQHKANLRYSASGLNSMEMEPSCPQCIINSHLLRGLGDHQLRFSANSNNSKHLRAGSGRRISLYADRVSGFVDERVANYPSADGPSAEARTVNHSSADARILNCASDDGRSANCPSADAHPAYCASIDTRTARDESAD